MFHITLTQTDRKDFTLKNVGRAFLHVSKILFIPLAWISILGSAVWVVYAGQKSIYAGSLSEQERIIYIAEQERRVQFKQKDFDDIRTTIVERKAQYDKRFDAVPDIFYPNGFRRAQPSNNDGQGSNLNRRIL